MYVLIQCESFLSKCAKIGMLSKLLKIFSPKTIPFIYITLGIDLGKTGTFCIENSNQTLIKG